MAFSHLYHSCSLIFLFQLFVLTSNLFVRTSGAASVLENVCHQTKDESRCLTILRSDPRSKTATPKQLAQIAIDTAEYNGIATKVKIHSYVMSTKDPKLENLYVKCENLYLDALGALADAPDDLAQGRYVDLGAHAQLVSNSAASCEATFNNKSLFKSGNLELEVLGQAIAVIAKELSS